MEPSSLISIIIPCFNDYKFVSKAVNSALCQTHDNIEIILVDDGSNLKTKSILKSLCSKIDLLITQENNGQSSARNSGIKAAKGEYIIVLDSDDYFEDSFAKKSLQAISENDAIKIVTCWGVRVTETDRIGTIFKPQGGNISNFICENSAIGNSMFRKSDWAKFGGYDESMKTGFEDWEFYIRMLSEGGIAYVIPEILFYYRIRKNSTSTKAKKIKYELRRYIFEKHHELYMNHFIDFTHYLLDRAEYEEREKNKSNYKIEYLFGKSLIEPIRWFKHIFGID